ncbi:hypothetical protein CSUI_003979, partial [Cystoisospora suis]
RRRQSRGKDWRRELGQTVSPFSMETTGSCRSPPGKRHLRCPALREEIVLSFSLSLRGSLRLLLLFIVKRSISLLLVISREYGRRRRRTGWHV